MRLQQRLGVLTERTLIIIFLLSFRFFASGQGFGESTIFGSFEVCSGSTSNYSTDFFPEGQYETYWEVQGGQINGSRINSTVSITWSSTPGNGTIYVYSQIIGTTTRYLEASQVVSKISGNGGNLGSVNVCQGQTMTLTLTGNSDNVARWEKSQNGGQSWSIINNTNVFLTIGPLHGNFDRYRAVVRDGCNNEHPSSISSVSVSIGSYLVQLTSPAPCSVTNSGSFGIEGGSPDNFVVKWQKKDGDYNSSNPWVDYSSSQTCSYSVTLTTTFKVIISSGSCGQTEDFITITGGNPSPQAGTILPYEQRICSSLSNAAPLQLHNSSGSIQWQYFSPISMSWEYAGSNQSILSNFPAITDNGTKQDIRFRAVVSNSCGSVESGEAIVTIDPQTQPGNIFSSTSIYCGSARASLNLTGNIGNVQYWQSRKRVGSGSWSIFSPVGPTDHNLYPDITPSGNQIVEYEYMAYVKSGVCPTLPTATKSLIVKPIPDVSGGNVTICSGQNTSITLSSPLGVTNTIYSWTVSAPNISGASPSSGFSINQSLSQNTSVKQTAIYSIIPSANGCVGAAGTYVVTVNPKPTVAVSSGSQIICSGAPMNTVAINNPNGVMGTTFSVSVTAPNILGANGGTLSSLSQTLSQGTTIDQTAVYTITPVANGCPGTSVIHTVTVNPLSNGGIIGSNVEAFGSANGYFEIGSQTGVVQRWQMNVDNEGWTNISGEGNRYDFSSITTNTSFRAFVKNGVCPEVPSNEAFVIIYPIPAVTTVESEVIPPNESIQLTVTTDYLTYQWYMDGVSVNNANAKNLVINRPGRYSVMVKGSLSSGTYLSEERNILSSLEVLQDVNYLRTTTYAKGRMNDQTDLFDLSSSEYSVSTNYFDGLGRPLQSVTLGGSGSGTDLILPMEYDQFGRESKKYLPYAHSSRDGRFQATGLADQIIFYTSGRITVPHEAKPFSETIFEPSPLNRVVKQGAPGEAWQPDANHSYASTDHTVKLAYEFNEANEVLLWSFQYPIEEYTANAVNAFGKVNAGTTAAPVYYMANQLYRNKTKDEQDNQIIEYVDKEGRTVLKRVQAVTGSPSTTDNSRHSNWASTYYIYDDFGNLVCVIPPEATNRLATQYFQGGSTDLTKNNFLKRWAFRYRYDGRRRMIMKQVPGAEPVYLVYDNRDRLALTQDGVQRSNRYWSFTKYDELNRPIATGLKDTSVVVTQTQMQQVVNDYYAGMVSKPWRAYGEKYLGEGQPKTVHGYTNVSYPQTTTSSASSAEHYLTVTYYDSYSFMGLWGQTYEYSDRNLSTTINGASYDLPNQPSIRVTGQVTGSKTKVIDGDFNGVTAIGVRGSYTWLKSISYYDDKYRLIQTIQDNYKGGFDRTTSLYDFTGKVLRTENIHETYDLTWAGLTKTFMLGNKLCSTTDFTTQWGVSGAHSADVLPAGEDGWLQWKAFQTYGGIVIGLSDQEVDVNYASIDYGIYMVGGAVIRVYENGVIKYSQTNGFKIGDVFSIQRNGTTITYLKNGTVFYTSATPSSSQLITDVAFLAPNILAYDVRSSFSYRIQSTLRRFDYDHAGRLTHTWHSVDGANEVLLAHNEYNELGQLIDKKLHSTVADASDAKQSVDYRYNIRGWLTSINNAQLTIDNTNDDAGDYFGMQLAYNTDLGTGNVGALQYNGNISATKWSNHYGQSSVKENAFNYTYDAMSRLKTANFRQQVAGTWGLAQYRAANGSMQSVNAFSETITNESASGYDLNGNIQFLKRTGKDGQLIDDLSYTYASNSSNILTRVTDAEDNANGFKELDSSIDDYTYDNNGNLLYDRNKSSEDLLRNGSFTEGAAEWASDNPSRTTFTNNRLEIVIGAAEGVVTQEVLIKNSVFHIVNISLVRTSATGSVNVRVGGSTNSFTITTSTSLSVFSYSTGTDDVKIIATPDFAGYIEEISVHTTTAITYNYLNLPEIVARGDDKLQYIYTATGQKLAQVVTEGTTTKTTDYAGEYVYENDVLQFINHEEGRIIPLPPGEGPGGGVYQYHLKDHLGNVRLTFTTKQEVEEVKATLETATENEERANFLKYDDIRKVNSPLFDHTTTGTTQYAMRLTGTPAETYGLARSISVMPGDKIKTEVFAKYLDTNPANWTAALTDLMAAIASGGTAPGTVIDGGAYGSPAASSIPFASPIGKSSEPSDIPKAYLNWLVFDKNFVPIASKSGFRRISTVAMENGLLAPEGVLHEKLESPLIEISEPGFVYIYLSNEEPGKEVYFDDFKVVHTKSPVIESTDYYPFGLTFNSYSRENSVANQYLYNGKEKQEELDLGWLDYGWRMYDPAMARWMVIDPFASKYEIFSPYNYAINNPILFIDPDGRELDYSMLSKGERKEFRKAFRELKRSGETGKSVVNFLKSKESGRYVLSGKASGGGAGSFEGNEQQTRYNFNTETGEPTSEKISPAWITDGLANFKQGEVGGVIGVDLEFLKMFDVPTMDVLAEEAVHAANYAQETTENGSNFDIGIARGNNEFSAKAVVGQIENELGRKIYEFDSGDAQAKEYGVKAFKTGSPANFKESAEKWKSQSSYRDASVTDKVPKYFLKFLNRNK